MKKSLLFLTPFSLLSGMLHAADTNPDIPAQIAALQVQVAKSDLPDTQVIDLQMQLGITPGASVDITTLTRTLATIEDPEESAQVTQKIHKLHQMKSYLSKRKLLGAGAVVGTGLTALVTGLLYHRARSAAAA